MEWRNSGSMEKGIEQMQVKLIGKEVIVKEKELIYFREAKIEINNRLLFRKEIVKMGRSNSIRILVVFQLIRNLRK